MAVLSRFRQSLRARTDSVLRSVLKNSGWAAIGQALAAGVGLIETIVLARYLSLNDFGVFVTINAAAELVYGLLDFRNNEAVIKFVPEISASKGPAGVSAFLRLILILDGLVSVVGFIGVALIGRFILTWTSLRAEYFPALIITAFGLAAKSVVRSVASYFRICGRFDQVTNLASICLLGRLALITVTGILVPTISGLSWAAAGANLLYTFVLGGAFLSALRHNGLKLCRASNGTLADVRRRLTTFLVSSNLAGTLRTVSTKMDTLLIVGLTSPTVGAIYKVAGRVAGSLMVFSDPLLVAVYPELSHLQTNGRTMELQKLLRTITVAFAAFAVAGISAFVVAGHWVLGTVAGPAYSSAYPVILTMFAGSAVSMIFFWARPLLLVRGYAKTLLYVSIAAFIVQITGIYLLAPLVGAVGAGLAFALNYIVHIGLYLYLIVRSGRKERAIRSGATRLSSNEITI